MMAVVDFPTFEQFRTLLREDNGFKDHFNLFLQLPVFAKRFYYSPVTQLFDISPYPSSNFQVVDHHSVWQWVYANRFPVFWRSELYYGYRLCYELNNSSPAVIKTNVVPSVTTVQQLSCTPKELQKFILFLRSSPGEAYYLIWLHMEKLRFSNGTNQQKTLIAKIKELFLVNGAPFQLEVTLRKDILFATSETSTLKEELECLLEFQDEVFTHLKTYWYEQYLIACETRKNKKEAQAKNEPDSDSEGEGEGEGEEEEDEEELNLGQPGGAFVDHGDESVIIEVPQEDIERKSVSSHDNIEKKQDATATRKQLKVAIRPFPSKSTYELFPLSSQSIGKRMVDNESFSQKLIPFVQSSIRCTFSAGNPLFDYLSRFHNDEITRITNYILFWESTELILTCDEMRRWYNGVKGTTDVTCPYLSLFDSYPLATDLETLLELYIDDSSDFYVDLPSEMQRQLLILLPKGLGHSLLIEVQDYACRVFEPFWAKYILQDNTSFLNACVTRRDLSHLVDAIQMEQSQIYHESLTIQEVLPATFDCTDTQSVKKMWYAVEYVEVLDNPGLLHLPSRLAMELYTHPLPMGEQSTKQHQPNIKDKNRVPTPGDIGPITYRGLTLTPMVTTIESSDYRSARRHVRTTIYSSQPAIHSDIMKKKPLLPESFNSLLRNVIHLENFYHFLCTIGNGVETNLIFWLAVEDMKDFIGDTKLCSTKIRRIMRRFFRDVLDITLHCQDSSLIEIAHLANPTPFQLMDAQEAVAKLLEARWYDEYIKFLTGDYFDEPNNKPKSKPGSRGSNKDDEETKSHTGRGSITKSVTQQSKITWRIFTRAVVGFRRGLMDPKTLNLFKKFLTIEVLNGDLAIGKGKKMIGRKMVNVTKLLSDLSFWAEVERFKDMADVINAAKDSGNYTPEDEIMIHKKAHAIVNCYIDSSVAPKIQINVPQDIVSEILDNMYQGFVNRSLFHKAAVHIFAILILYWKRFLLWRFAPKIHSTSSSMHSLESSSRWSGLNLSLDTYDSQMMLDGCILSFSLRTGLRLVRPISREKPLTIAMPSFDRVLTQSTVYRLKQSYQAMRMNRQSTREMINVH